MNDISPAAQSARESARTSDGRFGPSSTSESDGVSLSAGPVGHPVALDPHAEGDDPSAWTPRYAARMDGIASGWHQTRRERDMDPITGGCPADYRDYTEVDDHGFAVWSEDVANTPYDGLSEPVSYTHLTLPTKRIV